MRERESGGGGREGEKKEGEGEERTGDGEERAGDGDQRTGDGEERLPGVEAKGGWAARYQEEEIDSLL